MVSTGDHDSPEMMQTFKMPNLSLGEHCYTPLTVVMSCSNVMLRIQSYWKASHSQRPQKLIFSDIKTDYSDVRYFVQRF